MAAMAYTARKRDFKSSVWNEENNLMLLLSSISDRDDKAMCKRCGKELKAGSSSAGTSHLRRHPCAPNEEAGLGWGVGDAVAELQARPLEVDAVQWRQGQETLLLLRQEPLNLAELQQQEGLRRVLLLPELERRQQALMNQLEDVLHQQQQPAPAPVLPQTTSHFQSWLPDLMEDDILFVQAYGSGRRSGGGGEATGPGRVPSHNNGTSSYLGQLPEQATMFGTPPPPPASLPSSRPGNQVLSAATMAAAEHLRVQQEDRSDFFIDLDLLIRASGFPDPQGGEAVGLLARALYSPHDRDGVVPFPPASTPPSQQLNDAPGGDLNGDPAIMMVDFEDDPDTNVQSHLQGF